MDHPLNDWCPTCGTPQATADECQPCQDWCDLVLAYSEEYQGLPGKIISGEPWPA